MDPTTSEGNGGSRSPPPERSSLDSETTIPVPSGGGYGSNPAHASNSTDSLYDNESRPRPIIDSDSGWLRALVCWIRSLLGICARPLSAFVLYFDLGQRRGRREFTLAASPVALTVLSFIVSVLRVPDVENWKATIEILFICIVGIVWLGVWRSFQTSLDAENALELSQILTEYENRFQSNLEEFKNYIRRNPNTSQNSTGMYQNTLRMRPRSTIAPFFAVDRDRNDREKLRSGILELIHRLGKNMSNRTKEVLNFSANGLKTPGSLSLIHTRLHNLAESLIDTNNDADFHVALNLSQVVSPRLTEWQY